MPPGSVEDDRPVYVAQMAPGLRTELVRSRQKIPRITGELRSISTKEVQEFRDRVLRPEEPAGGSVYPLDDATDTLHVGVFVGANLAAIATICRQPLPDTSSTTAWRLRGMAALERFRGCGLGKRVAEACIAHAFQQGATMLWCSARLSAVGFYQSLGLKASGDSFFLPEHSEEAYVFMRAFFK